MAPEAGAVVWIVRRKWPDGRHYEMQGTVLGEDQHGTWIGAAPGWRMRGKDGVERTDGSTVVWCVPRDAWFLVHVVAPPREIEVYVDICTPASWAEDRVTVIDLDLDVVRWRDPSRPVELVDEDELEEHRVQLGYPDDLVAATRRAGDDVLRRVRAHEAPFTSAAAAPWFSLLED